MDSDGSSVQQMSQKDIYLLNKAMGLALSSQEKHRHGAVITKKGKIVSWGVNSLRNLPAVCSNPKAEAGRHAEREAIRRANTDLEGATIYVARINKNGNPLMSKPCAACQKAIDKAGIKRIFYTE